MASKALSIAKALKEYQGIAVNSGIVVVTGAVQQLATLANFKCPCVSSTQLSPNCLRVTETSHCTNLLNIGYGISFMIGPAITLFVVGMAGNPKFWKSLTGIYSKTEKYVRECDDICETLSGVCCKALTSPITWIVLTLLDGRYLACAITPLPYDVEHPSALYSSCEAVWAASKISLSDSFNDNRSFSQLIGWALIAIMAVIGMIIYSITQCTFPLTYYHAKYFTLYRAHEQKEFEDEMNKKAQREAEEDVLKFMKEQRPKQAWDRISTVYDFQRDKNGFAIYSSLHEWIVENELKEEKDKKKPEIAERVEEEETDHSTLLLPK